MFSLMGWMKYYQMKEKESFSNEKVSFLNENLVAKMYSAAPVSNDVNDDIDDGVDDVVGGLRGGI